MTERTRLQELQGLYSDVFKDVNGFRPRHTHKDDFTNEEWLEKQVDRLSCQLGVMMDEEKVIQSENVVKFEGKVAELISMGANTRQTAVRWLCEGIDSIGDIGYLEYHFNIPYGYIEGTL